MHSFFLFFVPIVFSGFSLVCFYIFLCSIAFSLSKIGLFGIILCYLWVFSKAKASIHWRTCFVLGDWVYFFGDVLCLPLPKNLKHNFLCWSFPPIRGWCRVL